MVRPQNATPQPRPHRRGGHRDRRRRRPRRAVHPAAGRELGVQAPSLYNHFATKEQILDAVGDSIVAGVDLSMLGPRPVAGGAERRGRGRTARRSAPTQRGAVPGPRSRPAGPRRCGSPTRSTARSSTPAGRPATRPGSARHAVLRRGLGAAARSRSASSTTPTSTPSDYPHLSDAHRLAGQHSRTSTTVRSNSAWRPWWTAWSEVPAAARLAAMAVARPPPPAAATGSRSWPPGRVLMRTGMVSIRPARIRTVAVSRSATRSPGEPERDGPDASSAPRHADSASWRAWRTWRAAGAARGPAQVPVALLPRRGRETAGVVGAGEDTEDLVAVPRARGVAVHARRVAGRPNSSTRPVRGDGPVELGETRRCAVRRRRRTRVPPSARARPPPPHTPVHRTSTAASNAATVEAR